MRKTKYNFEDLRDGDIVTFKKHNGRGYRITYRTVKIHEPESRISIFNGKVYKTFSYETYTGLAFDSLEADSEIISIIRNE